MSIEMSGTTRPHRFGLTVAFGNFQKSKIPWFILFFILIKEPGSTSNAPPIKDLDSC